MLETLRSLAVRSPALRYGLALGGVLAATLVRLSLTPLVHQRQPYILYFLAILFGAWVGGRTAGLVATALSAVVASVLFIPSFTTSLVRDPNVGITLFVFLVTGVAVSSLSQSLIGAQRAAQTAVSAARERDQTLRETEARLQISEERQRLALESAQVGTWHWDVRSGDLLWSDRCRELHGVPPPAPISYELFLECVHPDDRLETDEAVRSSIAAKTDFECEYRVIWTDSTVHWILSKGRGYYEEQGQPLRFEGIVLDIDARKETDRVQLFLSDLAERIRALPDADRVLWETVRAVGAHLGASRCIYADVDAGGMTGTFVQHFHRDEPAMTGAFVLDLFGPHVAADARAGCVFACPDVMTDSRTAQNRAFYEQLGVHACLVVPVRREDRLVALLIAFQAEPRAWTATERALLETVAERAWLTVANVRLLQATQAEVAERRRAQQALEEAYEREALINRIGQAIRNSNDIAAIQTTTLAALGKALHADRCYFVAYDAALDRGDLGPDWHRDGLESIAGTRRMSDYVINQDPGFQQGQAQTIEDVHAYYLSGGSLLDELGIRSLLRVPLQSDSVHAAIGVAMTDGPRQWTPNEIMLVETVAAQTQAAILTARDRQREQRIATTLEQALQPAVPEALPGLTVAAYCRAALEEARVGGDFYDVFALGQGVTALVIGDVSGKGLAAATQIATVRNMLRGVLYERQPLSEAVTALNAILTERDLLSGFVTLFAGVYDPASGQMTYVSCGHEPAIFLQVDGVPQELGPTGLPLGVSAEERYQHGTIGVRSGDVLLLYTDGVTEAGPSRAKQLGTAGVVEAICSNLMPDLDQSVQAIGASIDAYASGVLRDDICLVLTRFG